MQIRHQLPDATISLPLISQKGPASALPLRLGLAAGAGITVLGAAPEALLGGDVGMGY